MRAAIGAAGFPIDSAELTMLPKTTVAVEDEGEAKKILRLMDQLEDDDDVQDVHANFDIPERVLELVAGSTRSSYNPMAARRRHAQRRRWLHLTTSRRSHLGVRAAFCDRGAELRRPRSTGSLVRSVYVFAGVPLGRCC